MVATVVRRWIRRARRLPAESFAAALAVVVTVYVIALPLAAARYPLMTDLPLHAANASVLRHYADPAWHFREQLTLAPLSVPYMLFYVVAAAFMLVLPTLAAVKAAVFVMLALLPTGLAVLCWGMRKSPWLGVTGVAFSWGTLASWGFLNFVAALGLWALAVGLALRAVERSPRRAALMVGATCLVLFFTHPFRFPMALGSLALVIGLSDRERRHRALIPVAAGAAAAFAVWWLARPAAVVVELEDIRVHWERLALGGLGEHPYATLRGGADRAAFHRAALMLGALAVALAVSRWRRGRPVTRRDVVAHATVGGCVLGSLVLFLTLPMQMGTWWFIYPREVTAALFMSLALLPDLPRHPLARCAAMAWLALALAPLGTVALESHRQFHAATEDFAAITARLPHAPKLLHLVFDHHGAPSSQSPFLHLPGYVQAERGGWSSFSFAWLGHSPLVFREPSEEGAVVPPRPPLRWEWTPHRFRLHEHGAFFDWFLVRSRRSPAGLFAADPGIVLVAHEGTWWLFRRDEAAPAL